MKKTEQKPVMECVKTFQDACKLLKRDPKILPTVIGLPRKCQKSIVAHYKLMVIAEALNQGWKPNWKDTSQYKYEPIFEMDKPGFGFSCTYSYYWRTFSYVGSLLTYKSSELAKYAGTHFLKLYKEYFEGK